MCNVCLCFYFVYFIVSDDGIPWKWKYILTLLHISLRVFIYMNVLIPFLIVFEFNESEFLVNQMHSNQIQFALNYYHCLLCLLVFQISFLCNSIQFNPFIWNSFALQINDSWFWQPWTFSKLPNGSSHCIRRQIGDFGIFFHTLVSK